MNDAECITALRNGEKPDKVPFFAFGGNGFAIISNNQSLVTIYNDFPTTLKYYRETALRYGWLYTPYLAYASMGAWEMGGDIKWPDGEFSQAPSILKHPVTSPDQASDLEIPDVPQAGMVPRQIEFYKQVLSEADDVNAWKLTCQIEGAFTFASNIAGAALFSKWLIKRPDAAHQLLGKAVDFLDCLARHIKTLFGTEGILLFGGEPAASNQLISPKMLEEFALPYTRELHTRLLEMGFRSIFKHICGDQNLNLPHWGTVAMGRPGFVSFGHEVDLERAAEYFPEDVIVGNLNPTLIQCGSVEEVYKASNKILSKANCQKCGYSTCMAFAV
jgi:uroporphyrinogen decarboxylase